MSQRLDASVALGLLSVLALVACGRDVPTGRRCASAAECVSAGGGGTGRGPIGGPSGSGGASGAAGGSSNALVARIEDPQGMTLELLTLACAGECADVVAVARGGNPPYTFTWEDGSTDPERHVCLDRTSQLEVVARDTAIDVDEFDYEAQTALARLTATVLDCPEDDAGTSLLACVSNPSFEGEVTPSQTEAFVAEPWNACYAGGLTYSAIADATLWPFQNWTFPGASDGATYLALGQQLIFQGLASQTLCAPIEAGETRAFTIDLARAISTDPTSEAGEPRVSILGGTRECEESTVLWTSPPLMPEWTTHCVTLRPGARITTLAFRPESADAGQIEALIDHIVPVERCAEP